VPVVNRAGRIPLKNVLIFPGGIAEVFVSTPGVNQVVMMKHKGLMKLALETGASLIPIYTFGASDFFFNLLVGDSLLSKLSRRLRTGITMFFGQYLLPIPYPAKVSICIGKPIPVAKWDGEGKVSSEAIEELHTKVRLPSCASLLCPYLSLSLCLLRHVCYSSTKLHIRDNIQAVF